MNRPTKNQTKAIVYSCCWQNEASACAMGWQLAKRGGTAKSISPPWLWPWSLELPIAANESVFL